jgi:hypothetical protein
MIDAFFEITSDEQRFNTCDYKFKLLRYTLAPKSVDTRSVDM